MPIRESAKREAQYKELQSRLDQASESIRNDWAERLKNLPEFKTFVLEVEKSLEPTRKSLEDLERSFFVTPMTEAESGKTRQEIMVCKARLSSVQKVVQFVELKAKEVQQARKDFPNLENELKALERKMLKGGVI